MLYELFCRRFCTAAIRCTAAILDPGIVRSYMVNCVMHTCPQVSIIIVFRADWELEDTLFRNLSWKV